MIRDNASLVGIYIDLTCRSIITFNCGSCDKEKCNKQFLQIYLQGGAFCEECTNKNTKTKVESTCIEKFGVSCIFKKQENKEENVFKCKEIQDKIKETFITKYGVDNPMKNKIIQEKQKATIKEKYNVDNISQLEEIKEKKIQTMLKNHNVKFPAQVKHYKEKSQNTNLKKYGTLHPLQSPEVQKIVRENNQKRFGKDYYFQTDEFKQLNIEYWMKHYGVDNPSRVPEIIEKIKYVFQTKYNVDNISQLEEIKQKKIETSRINYGVDYPNQNPEHFEKYSHKRYKRKELITPSGKTIYLQGYEPFVYHQLLKEYKEEEILSRRTEVPVIWYRLGTTIHRYFCDFFLPHINLIIEVKSLYTYKIAKESGKIDICLQVARQNGCNTMVWIMNNKGHILKQYYNEECEDWDVLMNQIDSNKKYQNKDCEPINEPINETNSNNKDDRLEEPHQEITHSTIDHFTYTIDTLKEKILEDGATLIGDYKKPTSKTNINFNCHCGTQTKKSFRSLFRFTGAFCTTKCSNSFKQKETTRVQYTSDLLNQYLQRDQATCTMNILNINSESDIEFNCGSCKDQTVKKFKIIVRGVGAFCENCINVKLYLNRVCKK